MAKPRWTTELICQDSPDTHRSKGWEEAKQEKPIRGKTQGIYRGCEGAGAGVGQTELDSSTLW